MYSVAPVRTASASGRPLSENCEWSPAYIRTRCNGMALLGTAIIDAGGVTIGAASATIGALIGSQSVKIDPRTLFPYTTLFRSIGRASCRERV